jgi:hypothetical protein
VKVPPACHPCEQDAVEMQLSGEATFYRVENGDEDA